MKRFLFLLLVVGWQCAGLADIRGSQPVTFSASAITNASAEGINVLTNQKPLRMVATSGAVQWSQVFGTSVGDQTCCRMKWIAQTDIYNPAMAFSLTAGANGGTEYDGSTSTPWPSLYLHAAFEDQNGNTFPVNYGGVRTNIVLGYGAFLVTGRAWGCYIPKGAIFWTRTATSANGNIYRPITTVSGGAALSLPPASAGALGTGEGTHAVSGSTDYVESALTISGGNATGFGPVAILADYAGPAFLGIGDSIVGAQSSGFVHFMSRVGGVDYGNGGGWPARGAGFQYPYANLGSPGETCLQALTNYTRRGQLFPYANIAIEEYGINDLGSQTTNTFIPNKIEWWKRLHAAGLRVWTSTLGPYSPTSTDFCTTTNNQVLYSSGSVQAKVLSYNAWLRANYANYVEGIIDIEPAISTNGFWLPGSIPVAARVTGSSQAGTYYIKDNGTPNWTPGQFTGMVLLCSNTVSAVTYYFSSAITTNTTDTIYFNVNKSGGYTNETYWVIDSYASATGYGAGMTYTHPSPKGDWACAAVLSNALPAIISTPKKF